MTRERERERKSNLSTWDITNPDKRNIFNNITWTSRFIQLFRFLLTFPCLIYTISATLRNTFFSTIKVWWTILISLLRIFYFLSSPSKLVKETFSISNHTIPADVLHVIKYMIEQTILTLLTHWFVSILEEQLLHCIHCKIAILKGSRF